MIIIGCDFHTRFEQIAMLDTETGELVEKRLDHESGEAQRFYAGLKEPALVGIESTGYTIWFAEMLGELGHELVVGEAGKIRAKETRKQKHDRRDADHILNLLVRGDFPRIWLPSAAERDVRVLLEHRHQLVQWRTRAKNGLQAMALSYGVRRRSRLWNAAGREELQKLPLRGGMARRRADLLQLLRQLDAWVKELDQRIEQEVARRADAQRLMTHPGVGPLTALGAVLVLGPVERFPDAKHVTSYVGLIPRENSSGGRQRFGHLTKQGNRLLRFLLVEAAQIASRYDPGLGRVYRRLAFRKGVASAKIAVARKLAIRLYIMLRDQIDYAEFCRRGSHAGMLVNEPLV
ncbi:MAG: IS110 family transposase [Acidobacteriia bacterium]|nr:IS110 family transposase [Terriglobia bacterium]